MPYKSNYVKEMKREGNITKRVQEFEKTIDFVNSHLLKGVVIMAELTKTDNRQPMGKIKPIDKMVMMRSLFDGTKPATPKQHYERFNLYINFQTKSGHLTDPVEEAIDLFEHTLDKTALVWFQENLRNKVKTHQKPKRLMKPIHMKILTIIITIPQVRVEATDLIMVKVVTDNLEGPYNETEAKDLSIVNVSFKVIAIREAHLNKTVLNMAILANPISTEIKQIAIEAEARAVDLSNSKDAAMEGPIIRIAMECTSISITHTTHNQNNMALPAFYVVDLIIPISIATRENTT